MTTTHQHPQKRDVQPPPSAAAPRRRIIEVKPWVSARLAQGAFGTVSIGICMPNNKDKRDNNSDNNDGQLLYSGLVAIKTLDNAVVDGGGGGGGGGGGWGGLSLGQDEAASPPPSLKRQVFGEIAALCTLAGHPNIVSLVDLYCPPSSSSSSFGPNTCLSLVFPYCPWDLSEMIHHVRRRLRQEQHGMMYAEEGDLWNTIVQRLLKDVFTGVAHCHAKGVLHGDMKPSNWLLDGRSGKLCLTDFGTAQVFSSSSSSSSHGLLNEGDGLCTLPYRSPEVCLGASSSLSLSLSSQGVFRCDGAADIWGCGCILAELVLLRPLFGAAAATTTSVLDQLQRIFALFVPNKEERQWLETTFANYRKMNFSSHAVTTSATVVSPLTPPPLKRQQGNNLAGLWTRIMKLHPQQRWSAEQCLKHECFLSKEDGGGSRQVLLEWFPPESQKENGGPLLFPLETVAQANSSSSSSSSSMTTTTTSGLFLLQKELEQYAVGVATARRNRATGLVPKKQGQRDHKFQVSLPSTGLVQALSQKAKGL